LEGRRYREFRIENEFIDEVLSMDPLPRIDEVMKYKDDKIIKEDEDHYFFKFPFKHNQVDGVAV
jgi:hypothetical protein